MQHFDFVSDTSLRELLERDYAELASCVNSKAEKSVLLLSGSIIESVLSEYFLLFKPFGWNERNLINASLNDLIDLATSENLINEKEKKLLSVVKDYRNLLHLNRDVRMNEKYDSDTSKIAFSVTDIIINSIKDKYLLAYGLSAKDVFNKLRNDRNFHSVYNKVILKLNQSARLDLLKMLVDYEVWQKSSWYCFHSNGTYKENEASQLQSVKKFVLELKPLIPKEDIYFYLRKMVDDIETGENLKAFTLFNLFHEELGILSYDEQDLVVLYMLSFMGSTLENIKTIIAERTFSTIGHFIKSSKSVAAYLKFIDYFMSNFNSKTIENEMDLFEQIFNSLTERAKLEVENYFVDKFYNHLNDAPYDVKVFFSEINKRKLISIPKKEKVLTVI